MTLTGLTGKTSLRLLIVEDCEADARLMLAALRDADFEPDWERVETEADYLAQLDQSPELILCDYNLPQFDAFRALALLHERELDVPFIIVSGSIGEDLAVSALKEGAADYLLKDRLGRLGQAVASALAQKQLRESKRQLEEQFRHSQKMEAVGRLAGGVAHDFNNLLTVITGYTALALKSLHEGDPLREDILEIGRAASRAAALTRQLLAFSRRQILAPVVVDLNALLTGMQKLIERLIGERVDLSIQSASGLWPMKVDPGQMEQVVMNLAINSRDAMPGGGKLTIETANVELNENDASAHPQVRPGQYIRLAVTDNGCGMDAATRDRIFEPFFTTKGVDHGTGLGLATVYGIVTQSGGQIDVDSEPGVGTTFKIYIPRTNPFTPEALVRKIRNVLDAE